MALSTGRAQLHEAMKVASAHWDEVQTEWNDPVRKDFEKEFWEPLDPCVQATLRAMDRLATMIDRARQDCG